MYMSCETCTHAHEFMSTSVYESATPQFTAGACSRGCSHTSNVSNVDYQLSFIKLSGISMEELKGLSANTTCRTVSLCLTGTSLRTSPILQIELYSTDPFFKESAYDAIVLGSAWPHLFWFTIKCAKNELRFFEQDLTAFKEFAYNAQALVRGFLQI
jgi:hypothetical protein